MFLQFVLYMCVVFLRFNSAYLELVNNLTIFTDSPPQNYYQNMEVQLDVCTVLSGASLADLITPPPSSPLFGAGVKSHLLGLEGLVFKNCLCVVFL